MDKSAPTKGNLPITSCKVCAKPLIDMKASAKYCSNSCKQASYRGRTTPTTKKRKRKSLLEHLLGAPFGKILVAAAKRSGTVQIFPSNYTEEMFMELLDLSKAKMKANGTGKHLLNYPDNFELCHLSPAKGKDGSRGLFTPSNLVVAPAILNRKFGNKPNEYSKNLNLSVPRSKLLSKWKVEEGYSAIKVLRLINKHTNGALEKFQKTKKLKAHVSRDTGYEGLKPLSSFSVHLQAIRHVSKQLGLEISFDTTFEDLLTGNYKAEPRKVTANDDYWFEWDKPDETTVKRKVTKQPQQYFEEIEYCGPCVTPYATTDWWNSWEANY